MQINLSDVFALTNSEMPDTVRENEGADAKRRDKVLQKANLIKISSYQRKEV